MSYSVSPRRYRHRSRSRSPPRRHHSPSRRHRRRSRSRSHSRSPSPHKSKKSSRRDDKVGKSDVSQESMEIEEANALRAKLGLKPLKP